MSVTETDFLIVGQGLAGSLLAFSLVEKGQRVVVLDNKLEGSASKVAAGTINPITGHRLNITERFHDYLPVAEALYRRLEKAFDTALFHSIQQTRLIKNAGQARYFEQRLGQDEYKGILERADNQDFVNAPFGCANVGLTAIVDTKRLLSELRTWLRSRNAYQAVKVEYEKLEFEQNTVCYQQIKARKLIFCEGYQVSNNPWLNHLPFKLAKGDILTIEQTKRQGHMLSWGNWLVPAADHSAKLGSSFEWDNLALEPQPLAAEKLLDSLTSHTLREGRVVNHEVGVRPTTKHRKPFVGPLSNQTNAFCFNGLGSKGCLIAPYYSRLLVAHLLEQKPLPKEISQWL